MNTPNQYPDDMSPDEWDESEAWRAQINPLPPVTCEWCGQRYADVMVGADLPAGERPTQGDDCAAVVFEIRGRWFVEGFYGSSFCDMQTYEFVRNPPSRRADPVCDECLRERVRLGDLVFAQDNQP